jgi:hypothetical protein
MIRFDVVIAAKDVANTLGVCCKALRKIAYLNNLIIVVGKSKIQREKWLKNMGMQLFKITAKELGKQEK